MNDIKYIGLDLHQATISAAVLDSTGKPRHSTSSSMHCRLCVSRYGGTY